MFSKIFRMIFSNDGAGPLVKNEILPIATNVAKGAVPQA